jgi:cyclic pyranopterin phosphate synthase
MTTNGIFLPQKAKLLRKAGLHEITISLHSLKREKFSKIVGSSKIDVLERVLEGIDVAIQAGFRAIKINAVVVKGYNDDEILDLVKFARSKNLALRFIEFMPLDGSENWQADLVVTSSDIIRTISKQFKLISKGRERGDTSAMYEFEDGLGEVGIISPISLPFCDDCDRIRLTADGKLLTCLFDSNYHDLKALLRDSGQDYCYSSSNTNSSKSNNEQRITNGRATANATTYVRTDAEIASFIINSVRKKPPGIQYTSPLINSIRRTRPMHAIGG